MKKILTLVTILLTGFVLMACDNTVVDVHQQVFDSVNIIYQQGDSSQSITQNLFLTSNSGVEGATITWQSTNTAVISNTGVVTRPQGSENVTVVVVLSVTYDGVTKDKNFYLTVLPEGATTQYTITFDAQGGSAVAAITRASGSAFTSLPVSTRAEFTFGGWFLDAAGTQALPATVTGNVTVYAKWTPGADPNPSVPAGYTGISTKEEFLAITDFSAKYILTADIDFQGGEAKPLGSWGAVDWQGVIDPLQVFSGTFDGNGFALMNFKLTGSLYPGLMVTDLNGTHAMGTSLFPNLTGLVENLNIINATIVGDGFSGGVAGLVELTGTIRNVYFQGTVTAAKSWGSAEGYEIPAGGIAGILGGASGITITNVLIDADIIGGHIFFGYSYKTASNLYAVSGTLDPNVTLFTGQEKTGETEILFKTFPSSVQVVPNHSLTTITLGAKWSVSGATRPYLIRVSGGAPAWATA